MEHWTLDDIPWDKFDPSKLRPDLVALAKAACMVEYNGKDYARYLCEVFADDNEFQDAARYWAEEEVQHGQALRKWVELADPGFDFDKSFKLFTEGYKLPVNVQQSVRGSRTGELVARCIVETGTSSYYTAMKDATEEPVLAAVCGHIAADEFRHYKLFYRHLKRYLKTEDVGLFERLTIALGRITESEDDELAYAFFAAHNGNGQGKYDLKLYSRRYMACACALYRKWHIEQMTAMVFKAVGLRPRSWINRAADRLVWGTMQGRASRLKEYKRQVMAGAA